MADEQLIKRFLAPQADLKKTLEKLPKDVNSWFDGKVKAFKKPQKKVKDF